MVSITTPEKSKEEHERMNQIENEILQALKIPYQLVLLAAGDTGFGSMKTYDHEVWLPGQNKYRAYFINTILYAKHQAKVDKKLIADGFEEVIVTK